MEANKENVHRVKPTTRIPVPVHPLPALPKHLLTNNKPELRVPLRTLTLTDANTASSSSSQTNKEQDRRVAKKRKSVLKIDTKFVTMRPKTNSLEWDYRVFNDQENMIVISDDDSDERQTKELTFNEYKQVNCLGESQLAVTPALQSIELKGVRNIKKSLRRPHSRELQGLPNAEKNKVDEKVKRRLQFGERLQDRLQSPDHWKKSYMSCMNRDYSSDVFEYLLTSEQKPLDVPRSSSITRACVINWLMKINGPDGNPAIIQSASWYFDSILGTVSVSIDKLQLIAAACYWIAQKIHGPALSSAKLVQCASSAFTVERLLAAERAILERLKFPRQPVVPQEFITYLSWWCNDAHPGEIEVAATFFCMSGLMVNKALCKEFPSVVAAAAVRNAVLCLGKKDLMVQLQLCPVYQAAEKKAANMKSVSSILRRAVRTISAPIYEYNTPLEHYGMPPHYIAQTVINAANELAVLDTRHDNREGSASFKF